MRAAFEFIHNPEWWAFIALAVQAVILLLQAWILHQHSETMKVQADTAESIRKVLEQQTTILNQQFSFQQRIEAKAEWVKLYEALMDLNTTIDLLVYVGSKDQRDVAAEQRVSVQVAVEQLPPCKKLLATSIHLAPEYKKYFVNYVTDTMTLLTATTPSQYVDIIGFAKLQSKYADFLEVVSKVVSAH